MDIISIILLASYCAMFILLLTIPLRRRAIMLRAGRRIFAIPTKKRTFFKGAAIILLCVALVFVIKTRYFSVFVDIAFCGTAILGVEFVARLFSVATLCGAWQNAVLLDTEVVLYDDIIVFPVLQLPPEEQKNYPANLLVAETKSRGTVNLIFPSAEVCQKVLEVIFTERPELKPE